MKMNTLDFLQCDSVFASLLSSSCPLLDVSVPVAFVLCPSHCPFAQSHTHSHDFIIFEWIPYLFQPWPLPWFPVQYLPVVCGTSPSRSPASASLSTEPKIMSSFSFFSNPCKFASGQCSAFLAMASLCNTQTWNLKIVFDFSFYTSCTQIKWLSPASLPTSCLLLYPIGMCVLCLYTTGC